MLVLVVVIKVCGLSSEHLASIVRAALGAWKELHPLVVEVHQAVHEDCVTRICFVNFFELLTNE